MPYSTPKFDYHLFETPCISISNKSEIVQGLITEEVIRKRVKSMDDLRKGSKIVGILSYTRTSSRSLWSTGISQLQWSSKENYLKNALCLLNILSAKFISGLWNTLKELNQLKVGFDHEK